MAFFNEITGGFKRVTSRVKEWVARISGEGTFEDGTPPPASKKEDVESFVVRAFEDAKAYRTKKFSETATLRFGEGDPDTWAEKQAKLEAGNHWDVWGHRNPEGKDWMQEPVDNIIGDQVRIRAEHISANYHDVTISPDVENISEIFDSERRIIGWADTLREGVKMAKVTGDHYFKVFLDKSMDPRGIGMVANTVKGSVYLNPYAKSKKRVDGCWMIMETEMVTGQYVKEQVEAGVFKKDILDGLVEASKNAPKNIFTMDRQRGNYQLTKLYDKVTFFLDDARKVVAPIDPRLLEMEHQVLQAGEPAKVTPEDNHASHVEAHNAFLDTIESAAENILDPAEIQRAELVHQNTVDHIAEHIHQAEESGSVKMIPKYPHGRMIITIGGRVAFDDKSPYDFDFRELFHHLVNEKVLARDDGRSDVEILMQDNKIADKALARYEDATILGGNPKPWLHIEDKKTIEDQGGYDNDPTKVAYYVKEPPKYPEAAPQTEHLNLWDRITEKVKRKLGVGDVTIGADSQPGDSGAKVDSLQKQNQTIITGEPNANLSVCVEEMVKSLLKIYRQFYGIREYTLHGQSQAVNVSRILSVYQAPNPETGEMEDHDLPELQVTVRAASNFPFKWETDLASLMQFTNYKDVDGTPAVPFKMIQDMLIERFPQLPKYIQTQQATLVGTQVLAQEQAEQEAAQKTQKNDLQAVANQFKARERKQMVDQAYSQN